MNTLQSNPKERLLDLLLCLDTVADLLDPGRDAVERGRLALLLALLVEEIRLCQDQCDRLRAA